MTNAAGSNLRESLNGVQSFFLLLLRVLIGWHFLYEGVVKIGTDGWTAAGYLHGVPGPFAGIFETLAGNPAMVVFVDTLMKYGLTAIGLLLILGLFTRAAALGAASLLILFYLSNPPWIGVHFMAGEGSYLIVDKNLVEMAAALVVASFPAGLILGLDLLFVRE